MRHIATLAGDARLEGRRRIGALPLQPAPPALEIVGREHTYVCMYVCLKLSAVSTSVCVCMLEIVGREHTYVCMDGWMDGCMHACMYM